jgi:hypothetical protein
MKYYTCTAHIKFEFELKAESAEEAEQMSFELLADDVTQGTIRVDLVGDAEGFNSPILHTVDIQEMIAIPIERE